MAILLVLVLASTAFAQPALTEPVTPVSPVEEKDPSIAVLLSVGITTGGVVTLMASDSDSMAWLGLGALYFGPSTGQWYAGEHGGLGLAARALGAVSGVYGFTQLLESENRCEFDYDNCDTETENARAASAGRRGTLFMLAGAGLWVGSTIADVVLARRAAMRWNKRHGVVMSPTVMASSGQRIPGVVLTARF